MSSLLNRRRREEIVKKNQDASLMLYSTGMEEGVYCTSWRRLKGEKIKTEVIYYNIRKSYNSAIMQHHGRKEGKFKIYGNDNYHYRDF